MNEFFNELLDYAILNNCSDIHIDYNDNKCQISLRYKGRILNHKIVDDSNSIRLYNYILFKANLDIVDKNILHTGSICYKENNLEYYLRVSVIPTLQNKSIVIRILNNHKLIDIDSLSIIDDNVEQLKKILTYSNGMIVFTGKTGSGKTTTMYALIEQLKKKTNKKIITLEDPVERKIDGVLQIGINNDYQTYFKVLKQVLRHDPDIIVIGEVRDEADLKLAVQAALSGHLVLTSMHAINAKFAINRLLELNISLSDLKACIKLIGYQELLYTKNHNPFSIYEFINNDDLTNYLDNNIINYTTVEHLKSHLKKKLVFYEGK